MRILMAALLVAAAGGSAAMAQPGGATDIQYLKAARCAGLASSANLGGGDASAFDAWLKANRANRSTYALEQASARKSAARMQANKATGYGKSELQAELSGACAALKG
ncbi:MAG TPA: hypothetical protein VF559_07235 [Caulobacteraceae bacterium]|jgi:hypothetical protein